MPSQRVWISFDLGVQGDYEGLYQWLDGRNAIECGDSVASFDFAYAVDLPRELGTELVANVRTNQRSRVYLIFVDAQGIRFGWLIGRGQRPAWEGYAPSGGAGDATFGWEPPTGR
jgi:hypothetical protein